jgi:hypothetical protein
MRLGQARPARLRGALQISCRKTLTAAWLSWKWKYDADAEHARYLQRHPEKASVTQAA